MDSELGRGLHPASACALLFSWALDAAVASRTDSTEHLNPLSPLTRGVVTGPQLPWEVYRAQRSQMLVVIIRWYFPHLMRRKPSPREMGLFVIR